MFAVKGMMHARAFGQRVTALGRNQTLGYLWSTGDKYEMRLMRKTGDAQICRASEDTIKSFIIVS